MGTGLKDVRVVGNDSEECFEGANEPAQEHPNLRSDCLSDDDSEGVKEGLFLRLVVLCVRGGFVF